MDKVPDKYASIAEALDYRLLEGDQGVMPSIFVVETSGHTPGHQSISVRLCSDTSYILAGDTICLKQNLTPKIPTANNWSNQQAMDSIDASNICRFY